MKVFYDFIVEKNLNKAKKPELVKFTKEVLGEKIPTTEKKEVFYNEVCKHIKDRNISLKKYIEYFNLDLEVQDIVKELSDEDIYYAVSMLKKKINYLYYKKSKAKTSEEQKEIFKHIGKIFSLRNNTLIKLINLKKVSISSVITHVSECARVNPIYVDTVTGKELFTSKYMLFPNMKYCRIPKKNKALDLNNINFLGDYKEVKTKETVNKSYVVSINGVDYLLPESYKSKITVEINEDELINKPYEYVEKKLVNTPVDDIEYQKAIYIIHKFLEDELFKKKKKVNNNQNNNSNKNKQKPKQDNNLKKNTNNSNKISKNNSNKKEKSQNKNNNDKR